MLLAMELTLTEIAMSTTSRDQATELVLTDSDNTSAADRELSKVFALQDLQKIVTTDMVVMLPTPFSATPT